MKINNLNKIILSLIFIFFISINPNDKTFAEGSRDLISSGGDRVFLDSSDLTLGGLKRKSLIRVFLKNGEVLHTGSSANGLVSGKIVVTDPSGKVYTSTGVGGLGIINNRTEEVAGPFRAGNTTGYKSFAVLADMTGVYTVEFRAPIPGNTAGGANFTAAAPWTRATDQPKDQAQVLSFDATVVGSNNAEIKGRVFTNALTASMRGNSRAFSANLFILTKGGWLYSFDANGMDPWGFIFLSNSAGNMKPGTKTSLYKSVPEASVNIHDPESPDGEVITHKIFFNRPSLDLPETARSSRGEEWLSPNPKVVPGVSGFEFRGLEGTQNNAAYLLGGNFVFNSTADGKYNISIDVNENGKLNDSEDVSLTGNMKAGENKVFWNGKNNNGGDITARIIKFENMFFEASYAEVHFPLYDVETNNNGFILKRENGPAAPDYQVYFNNSDFTDVASFPEGRDNRTGRDSRLGAHKWKTNAGDKRVMDTWGYIDFQPKKLESDIELKNANLAVISNTNNLASIKDDKKVLFNLAAINYGPSDVKGAYLFYRLPEIVTDLEIVSCTVLGGGTCFDGKLVGRNFTARIDAKANSQIRLTVSGTILSNIQDKDIEIVGGIMRPNDVYDAEATSITNVIYTKSLEGLRAACVDAGFASPPCDNYSLVSYKKKTDAATPLTIKTAEEIKNTVATSTINTSLTNIVSSTTPQIEALKKILRIIYKEDGAILSASSSADLAKESKELIGIQPDRKASSSKKIVRDFSKNVEVMKDARDDFTDKVVSCKPPLLGEISEKSSVMEINKLKSILNEVASNTLILNGKYDESLKNAVKEYQERNLHKLTILKAAGIKDANGIAGSYTIAQLNLDSCYIKIPNRCPYFYDYLTLGDKNGITNKLQISTTTQVNVWKEFINQVFPSTNLKYNGVYDKEMRAAVGKYQSYYKRVILSPWKTANPKASVTYYLRESSRNWGNYMVKCPEGPIELYDGSGNVNYR